MTTVVSICNLALSHLGDSAKVSAIDPPDGSTQAMYCATYYPLARDLCLSKHDWGFASRRASLSAITIDATLYPEFSAAFALPANFVRLIGPVDPSGADTPWRIESLTDGTRVLLTTAESPLAIQYVYRETDTGRYPAEFAVYLSYELAVMLTGPLRKDTKRAPMVAAAQAALVQAAGVDSNADATERHRRLAYRPPWVAGR